jgi:hypothetical protein
LIIKDWSDEIIIKKNYLIIKIKINYLIIKRINGKTKTNII